MPYIVTARRAVTTTVPEGEGHPQAEMYRRLSGAPLLQTINVESSRRAVATLDEANARVYEEVALATGGPEDDALRRRIGRLPESGGTVGLPDGTVIEVEPVTVRQLVAHLAGRKYQPGFEREFIDAFNAQEEAR